MRFLPQGALVGLVVLTTSIGCAHSVQINSDPPGAEVFVRGQAIGTTPVAWQDETGEQGQVEIVLKRGGEEKTVIIQKNQLAWEPIGAGAAAGAGACLGLGCLGGGAISMLGSVFPLACFLGIPLGIVQLVALAAGPGVAWWLYGNKGPEAVTVDLTNNSVQTVPPGLAAIKNGGDATELDY